MTATLIRSHPFQPDSTAGERARCWCGYGILASHHPKPKGVDGDTIAAALAELAELRTRHVEAVEHVDALTDLLLGSGSGRRHLRPLPSDTAA